MKKLGIIGCGWTFTKNLDLLQNHFDLVVSTTTPLKLEYFQAKNCVAYELDFSRPSTWSCIPDFLSCESLLIGLPVSRTRDDAKRDSTLYAALKNYPGKIYKLSSTGVYPSQHGIYTEKSSISDGLLADAENLFWGFFPDGKILRLGGLMGGDRKLNNFTKRSDPSFLGKQVNYIHYEDVARAFIFIEYENPSLKVYNVVAPEHPTVSQILEVDGDLNSENRLIIPQHLEDLKFKWNYPDPRTFAK